MNETNLAVLDKSIHGLETISRDESLSPEGFAARVRYWTDRLGDAVAGDRLDLDGFRRASGVLRVEFRDAGPENVASAMAEALVLLSRIEMLLPGLILNQKLRELEFSRKAQLSRRTRSAVRLALLLLPCPDRERYGQEYASELAELPQRGQARHVIRLVSRSWSLRRALKGADRRSMTVVVSVGAAPMGIAGGVIMATVGIPTVIIVGMLIFLAFGLTGWVLCSSDRTDRLANLISAARGQRTSDVRPPGVGKRRA